MKKTKNKILNDPIYGFIAIPSELVYKIIEHPYFQRLRRISQLGLSYLVYPGAHHTRFHHAIGAMHLMQKAIRVLKSKNIKINSDEEEGLLIAILLHDIGHGPFSHALEHSLVNNISHEKISIEFMKELNKVFKNKLSLAIKIFQNKYKKKYLHELISSQIDVDRLDYLNRDSFYSGVAEGIVNSTRIIDMYNVYKGKLVLDYKGLYTIEKFLLSRKLMYLQVYMHKTVLSAEHTLMNILKRAKYLASKNEKIFMTDSLKKFLKNEINMNNQTNLTKNLNYFSKLDDYDIMISIKEWQKSDDIILSMLSKQIIERKLHKIKELEKKELKKTTEKIKQKLLKKYSMSNSDLEYLVFSIETKHKIYVPHKNPIYILKQENNKYELSGIEKKLKFNKNQNTIIKNFICYHPIVKKL
tara:strand:- start:361 stop:1599 length:1239 start_codon:yes stop_codon:yes gene_type:complete